MKQERTVKNTIFLIISLGIILFFATFSMATNMVTDKATVKVETTSLDSKILELISQGEEVEVLKQEGEWYQVRYKKITGYLRNDLLELDEETQTSTQQENTQENTQETQNTVITENVQNIQNQTNEATQTTEVNEANESSESNNETEQETEKSTENEQNNQAETQIQQTNAQVEELSQKSELLGTYKTKETIKLKITPLIMSIDIAEVANEKSIEVIDIINNWAYAQYEGKYGWVRCEKIEQQEKVEEQPEQTEQSEENQNNEETNTQEQTTENQQSQEEQEQNAQEQIEQQPEAEQPQNTESQTKTMYINSQTVNLRKEASTSSSVLTQLSINTQVEVISEQNGWSKVQVDGKTGYISSTLLSDKKQETSRGADELRGTTTQTEETEQETTTNNSSVTSTDTQNIVTTSTSSTGASVVSYANQFLGKPYVYGGTSPSGFDCSGFTYYVYKHFGVTLNRTAAGQYSNGTAVSKADLQVGDLVMFGSPIWHVGIYIGNGKIIHAANPSRGVTTDTIQSGYYYNNYAGARRIF